jgi:hypothetical protein
MTKVSVRPQRANNVATPYESSLPAGAFPHTAPPDPPGAPHAETPASRAACHSVQPPFRKHLVVIEAGFLFGLKVPRRRPGPPPGSPSAPALAA